MLPLALRDDELKLISALQSHAVTFVVVGGYAVVAHGFVRFVEDLDVLVLPAQANAIQLKPALASVGVVLTPEFQQRIASPQANCRLPSLNSQLLGHIAGVSTTEAILAAVSIEAHGKSLPILSLAHLIANKEALGRPKDLADVAALRCLAGA